MAQQVVGARTNPYDKAAALRDFFRGGSFTYDPTVAFGDDAGAMSRFLSERHGACQQFATTYAVMARLDVVHQKLADAGKNAFSTAKAVATLDLLSKGRFIFGIGTG